MDKMLLLRKIRFYILVSVFLFLGTSCMIFHPRQKPHRGELITSIPHGRMEWGEKDNMSGGRNELSGKKKKKSKKKEKNSYKPAKKKKYKRR
ncbi:MAG: hypothetical protein WAO52_10995 [Prolixibacteraceae bacterium]